MTNSIYMDKALHPSMHSTLYSQFVIPNSQFLIRNSQCH